MLGQSRRKRNPADTDRRERRRRGRGDREEREGVSPMGDGRERPHGVAVWEIAAGDGQRARNRWALRGIIMGSQK